MANLEYRLITKDVDLNSFNCGNSSIENQLKEAYDVTLLRQGYCYEIIVKDTIVGYFLVSLFIVSNNFFDDEYYTSFMEDRYPALYINFIAIDNKYKNNGIGKNTLRLYIDRIRYQSLFPIRSIIIDAIRDKVMYYKSIGFIEAINQEKFDDNSPVVRMIIDLLSPEAKQFLNSYIE